MTLYFSIMEASCGGISYESLEGMPYDKLSYLSRAARAYNIRRQLESIYNMSFGFHGEKKGENKLWKLQEQMRILLLEDARTDVETLKAVKQKMAKAKGK